MPSHEKKKATSEKSSTPEPSAPKAKKTMMGTIREWTDAIIIAYILAMFIRTFVVELFKIPSGSMTPTLVGDNVAEVDYDNNGQDDLLVLMDRTPIGPLARYQVFLRDGEKWDYQGEETIATAELIQLASKQETGPFTQIARAFMGWNGPIHKRNDKIFVNKFSYWFGPPDRGDLIVFKVPRRIWSPLRPIYIKRAVGFENETIAFATDETCAEGKGRLEINGNIVTEPRIFQNLCYAWRIEGVSNSQPPENTYEYGNTGLHFVEAHVPKGHLWALGDNTDSSLDGRYWGAVPLENLKGKAFFRYSPLSKMGFLH